MENEFDLLVLGAGPGGYVAAIRAAQLGLRAAVIEKKNVGGVCLNIGCIPSKSLIHSASVFSSVKQLTAFGVSVDTAGFDYAAVFAQSRKVAEILSKGVQYLLEKNGVTVIYEEGRLVSHDQIRTQSGKVLQGKYILVATGSRPKRVPGLEFDGAQILSSDDILMSDSLPKSLCIIGGGAIGCEFAHIMRTFQVDVTLVEAEGQLLPAEDAEISKVLLSAFKKKRVAVHTGAKASVAVKTDQGVTVEICQEQGAAKQIVAEKVLVVAGRMPNTAGIGLEECSVELQGGFIRVDDNFQTRVPGIFAIGDVIQTPMLAHVASKEAELAVEFMAGATDAAGGAEGFSQFTPHCVYCEPQVAGFGMTEAQARDKGASARTFPFRGVGKAVATEQSEGMVKIIADEEGYIKGAHIVGANATELIHELALAAARGIKTRQIAEMIHAHPTLSESLMECARVFENRAIHI
ncbi:MAG: dihydrolipoyl dehydrogenase [Clostridiales Family XIII bacterium]|jgi:dihydrolipoamide dehydrogenase|nr:dihydrolipoyl dehydrogenase [Clostridiales Family XIII bacterium]